MKCIGKVWGFGALVAIGQLAPQLAWAADFTWIYHHRPPFYIDQGNKPPTGQLIEKANILFSRAGVTFDWQRSKAKQVLSSIEQNHQPLCSVGWFKTPERAAYAQFTQSFHQDKGIVALYRQNDERVKAHKTIKSLFSDKALRIGTQQGYSYGPYVDELLKSLSPTRVEIKKAQYVSAMLTRESYDYIVMNHRIASKNAAESAGGRVSLAIMELDDAPPGNKRYVMCSKKVDPAVIKKINAAIVDSGASR